MHPFRAAIENGASPEEFAALFASDVTFHTPILEKTVKGRDMVLRMVLTAAKVVDTIHYTQEMSDAHCTILLVPDTISDEVAAQLIVNPMPAWIMLTQELQVERGEWLVQTAANSTVGRLVLFSTPRREPPPAELGQEKRQTDD